MVRYLAGAAAVLAVAAFPAFAATTYSYIGPLYTDLHNHTTCTVGTCTDYSTSMKVTGSFTVSVPLAANLSNVDISTSANLVSWSFFDGVNTISNTGVNAYTFPGLFRVTTDASGNVSSTDIYVEILVRAGPNNRINDIAVGDNAPGDYGLNNFACLAVSGNECTNANYDTNSSWSNTFTNGAWTTSVAPTLTGVVSRKVHGAAGTFDLPLSLVTTNPTTEPRQGPTHTIVFTFGSAVTAATPAVTEGIGVAGVPTFNGNEVTVGLTGVADQQYLTVALSNLDGGGGSVSVRLGFLRGDVNQNRVVSVADLGLVNAQLAQFVTQANFLKDVNASGTLTVADKAITNANLTLNLPAPQVKVTASPRLVRSPILRNDDAVCARPRAVVVGLGQCDTHFLDLDAVALTDVRNDGPQLRADQLTQFFLRQRDAGKALSIGIHNTPHSPKKSADARAKILEHEREVFNVSPWVRIGHGFVFGLT